MKELNYGDLQFRKYFTKDSFVELLSWHEGGKVVLGFGQLDKETMKTTNYIKFYLGVDSVISLRDAEVSGALWKKMSASVKKAKSEGKDYADSLWSDLGGTPARGDKGAIARTLNIDPSTDAGNYILRVMEGEGAEAEKGLIQFAKGSKPTTIRVKLSPRDLKGLLQTAVMMEQSFITKKFIEYIPYAERKDVDELYEGFALWKVYKVAGRMFKGIQTIHKAISEIRSILDKASKGA
jgi:hypothetical protein